MLTCLGNYSTCVVSYVFDVAKFGRPLFPIPILPSRFMEKGGMCKKRIIPFLEFTRSDLLNRVNVGRRSFSCSPLSHFPGVVRYELLRVPTEDSDASAVSPVGVRQRCVHRSGRRSPQTKSSMSLLWAGRKFRRTLTTVPASLTTIASLARTPHYLISARC